VTNDSIQLSRKEREEAFRRDLVLDAAEALFGEKGFDGTTVSDIAERAELAKGSLYHLFESKQEIVNAIVNRKVGQVIENVNDIFARDIEPIEKILLLIEHKLSIIWESKSFAKLFVNEFHGFNWRMDLPILECAKDEIHGMFRQVEMVIAEAQKKGQIRDDLEPNMVLASMGGISNAVVHLWLKHGQDIDPQAVIRQVKDIFLNGVAPVEEVKGS